MPYNSMVSVRSLLDSIASAAVQSRTSIAREIADLKSCFSATLHAVPLDKRLMLVRQLDETLQVWHDESLKTIQDLRDIVRGEADH